MAAIEGLSGSGTKEDPIIVKSWNDFLKACDQQLLFKDKIKSLYKVSGTTASYQRGGKDPRVYVKFGEAKKKVIDFNDIYPYGVNDDNVISISVCIDFNGWTIKNVTDDTGHLGTNGSTGIFNIVFHEFEDEGVTYKTLERYYVLDFPVEIQNVNFENVILAGDLGSSTPLFYGPNYVTIYACAIIRNSTITGIIAPDEEIVIGNGLHFDYCAFNIKRPGSELDPRNAQNNVIFGGAKLRGCNIHLEIDNCERLADATFCYMYDCYLDGYIHAPGTTTNTTKTLFRRDSFGHNIFNIEFKGLKLDFTANDYYESRVTIFNQDKFNNTAVYAGGSSSGFPQVTNRYHFVKFVTTKQMQDRDYLRSIGFPIM